jgi:hypothetical protein
VQQNYLTTSSSGLWSICAGDLNNDGYNDLCLGDGSHVEFLYANSSGTAYTSLFYPDYIFSQRSTMNDIDNDGWLDAFVCHDVDQSHPYRNNGSGLVVEDQSLVNTLPVGGNYAAIWCDYDNDQDDDLYITKCRSGAPVGDPQRINLLYRNNGNGTFTEVGAATGMNDGEQSWSTVFEDFDNDGDFDGFIVNHTGQNKFMVNNGNGTFTNAIAGTGIDANDLGAWESQGADFDNDGWVDIFSEVGGGIYRNNGDGTFTNINIAVDEGGIGDLNNDGKLDYQLGGTIYLNTSPNNNHWVKTELRGIISNRNGIGSRIELYGPWGRQIREMRSGQGFSHMNSLQVHFGLGSATAIDSMVVYWPSGIRTVVENPGIDQLHVVPEGQCTLPPFTIAALGSTQLCPGQTVQLEAPAGYAGYMWSNGATGQTITVGAAGNYSVAGESAGQCIGVSNTIPVTVTTAEQATITVNGDDVICQGASTELEANAGAAYLWSTGETTQSIQATQNGPYTVTVQGTCFNTTSAPVSITVNAGAPVPSANDVTIPAAGTADLQATGDNILWYDDPQATTSIGAGNTWTTPFLTGNTTFWCEANAQYGGSLENGGKPDNSGGGGQPASGSYSLFNSWEEFIIESVTVYAIGAGVRDVNLCDANGTVLQTASFNLADGMQTITLNFNVPVGTGLSLRCPQNNIFRNNAGVQYPYAIGTMGELYTSGFGTSYYYYFYNWQVRRPTLLCPSARVPVEVFVGAVGLDEQAGDRLAAYPVPADDVLVVTGMPAGAQARLVDMAGRVALEVPNGAAPGNIQIDVSGLAPGTYVLLVAAGDRTDRLPVVVTR